MLTTRFNFIGLFQVNGNEEIVLTYILFMGYVEINIFKTKLPRYQYINVHKAQQAHSISLDKKKLTPLMSTPLR